MPELPEVETVARTLRPHVRGCQITAIRILRDSCVHPQSLPLHQLLGARITDTDRRGKLLLLHLQAPTAAGPDILVAHLRMTGRMLPQPLSELPHPHTRCILSLRGQTETQLFFDDTRTFGKLLATSKVLLAQWDFWRQMGPEPLEMKLTDLAPRLKGKRPLKQALLDQKVIAGIGNIYADEALFRAGLSPLRPADSLDAEECSTLMGAIQKVLRLSIAQCGSSIRDYRDANGNVGAFQNSFQAYGRGGQRCLKCGTPMTRIKCGGRATVFCPHCQRVPAS